MPNEILKNINAFVDGRSYAGEVKEYTPPKIVAKFMEYSAGGMSAPVDIAMGAHEKLEADISLCGFDPDVISSLGWPKGPPSPLPCAVPQKMRMAPSMPSSLACAVKSKRLILALGSLGKRPP